MSKITAIYVRVSHRDQSHASQLADLQKWVATCDGPVRYFQDTFTGRTMNRPAMEDLLTEIQAGKVERIVIWRLDRLGRTARGLCQLFDELRERKVDLVSLRDGFSLDSPGGRLHARILASIAEFETEVRGERVAAGQAAARKRGKRWGGSTKGRRLKVKPEQVIAAQEMQESGKSISVIARVLSLSRPTVYKLLKEAATT